MAAVTSTESAAPSLALLHQQVDASRGELALLRQQLADARSDAKLVEAVAAEAHRRQVMFLATVAHELRNPLMPLRLAAVMLDRARTDDAAHARLQATITGQVAQMTRLIGDLLEGSRISTGNFRLERTVIDLDGVLDRAIETSQPGMEVRRHSFERSPRCGPVMVLGDAVRLVQVFGNLLENASKYTLEGGALSLHVAIHGHAVVVTIKDNGIGITEQALPHVFDMFVRDVHATEVNEGGLGIGLAVVRELVKAHEGTVTAVSRGRNQGSEFAVMLPLATAVAWAAGEAPVQ
jgi:signal transduction histidine kinase